MRIKTIVCGLIVMLVVVNGLLAACGGPASTETVEPTQEEQPTAVPEEPEEEEPTAQPPAGDGAALLEEHCTRCHALELATQAQKTREEWEQTVTRMVGKGAQLTEDEQGTLIEYLAATYGP
jgi:cytochrome c5